MAAESNNVWERLLNIGEAFAVPLARKVVYGGERASQMELAAEAARINRLNGSGAPDELGNLRLPRTPSDKVRDRSLVDALSGAISDNQNVIVLVIVGLVAILIAKKLF